MEIPDSENLLVIVNGRLALGFNPEKLKNLVNHGDRVSHQILISKFQIACGVSNGTPARLFNHGFPPNSNFSGLRPA